jgi:hypothetical protein
VLLANEECGDLPIVNWMEVENLLTRMGSVQRLRPRILLGGYFQSDRELFLFFSGIMS